MNNYPIGDFLIRAKNVVMAGRRDFTAPKSGFVLAVAQAIVELGFFEKVEEEKGELRVRLRYHKKQALIEDVKVISRPGLRKYASAQELGSYRGPAVLVVSTPKGVMGHAKAVKDNLGGEVLAEIL